MGDEAIESPRTTVEAPVLHGLFSLMLERGATAWRYALTPITGRKHQLRVHMAALGAPIANDPLYPVLIDDAQDDPQRPLQLLARSLEFIDPVTGVRRRFDSGRSLTP